MILLPPTAKTDRMMPYARRWKPHMATILVQVKQGRAHQRHLDFTDETEWVARALWKVHVED